MKNKDIPEFGSKGTILLNAADQLSTKIRCVWIGNGFELIDSADCEYCDVLHDLYFDYFSSHV